MTINLLGAQEFYTRFAGRFFGKFKAVVRDVADPRKLGRIKVFCAQVYGDDLSPWCLPNFPMGGHIETGMIFIPPVQAMVWLEFEEGNKHTPVYSGGFYLDTKVGRPGGVTPIESSTQWQDNPNSIPSHAQGIPDGSDLDGGLKGNDGVPESNFAGTYPNVRVLKTPAGHMLEFDDTPLNERIQIHHKSGAHTEMLPDGSINIISSGTVTRRSVAEKNTVEGNQTEVIKGSSTLRIDGNFTIDVGGRFEVTQGVSGTEIKQSEDQFIDGDLTQSINGSFNQTVLNSIIAQCGDEYTVGCGGNFNLDVGGFGSMIFVNSQNVGTIEAPFPDTDQEALNITAMNGKLTLASTDLTGSIAKLGIEIKSQGDIPPGTILPIGPSLGPHIYLGNLLVPPTRSVTGEPTVFEPAVLGLELVEYLTALQGVLKSLVEAYLAHLHPMFSPPTNAIETSELLFSLEALEIAFLQDIGPELQPSIVSDIVFLSKR